MPAEVSAEDIRNRRESRAENSAIVDFNVHRLDDHGTWKFVGMTGIFGIDTANDSCEVGIVVDPDTHGKGLATEVLCTLLTWVFEERKIHRATFETSVENVGMRGWLEKAAGARLEAERREAWNYGEGSYGDVCGYSILKWEWTGKIKANLEKRLLKPPSIPTPN